MEATRVRDAEICAEKVDAEDADENSEEGAGVKGGLKDGDDETGLRGGEGGTMPHVPVEVK